MLTSPGAVIGTVAYMSPEQVRGDPVDHRTDLFSFGSVLYEMATGHRAFRGKTSALIFDAILHATPPALANANPAARAGLQAIVDKALEKDPHLRYQHAEDLRTDLERLRHHDGALQSFRESPRRWRMWLALAALLLVVAAMVVYVVQRRPGGIPDATARQVTSGPGVEDEPAVSPDGKTIAFTSDAKGTKDVWIVDVHGGPLQRITAADTSDESHPAWFPDGRSIAFTSDRRIPGHADVWRGPDTRRRGGHPARRRCREPRSLTRRDDGSPSPGPARAATPGSP